MTHDAADDANAAATACVPPDVLASVLLRLPATDLRRFRRVCKGWREVISDPVFIKEHMEHGPSAPTHTVVFLHGREEESPDAPEAPHNGHGFLFDEEWRLVARFRAGDSEEMVGTCNGLLCFFDVHRAVIKVVEPFTGESLALPQPPKTDTLHDGGAYCSGFDPVSRRCKIFHLGLNYSFSTEQGLFAYTIGEGENSWKRVVPTSEAFAAADFNNNLVFAGGSLYWSMREDDCGNLASFNLATEEITSTPLTRFLPAVGPDRWFNLTTDSDARMCVITVGDLGAWDVFSTGDGEDGRWTQNSYSGLTLVHPKRHLTWRQALQRGHLLLQDSLDYQDGGLYAHPIEPAAHYLGSGKLLLNIRMEEEDEEEPAVKCSGNTHVLFVPALLNQAAVPEMVIPLVEGSTTASTFCYAPPVSPAALLAFHMQAHAENKLESRS